jgi:NADP-dependent 3-hydroxy acid dehydrogenase YdfG
MRLDLNGRTALVSGSTQGIGRAIAAGLSAAGARVAVNGRDPAAVDKEAAGSGITANCVLAGPTHTGGALRVDGGYVDAILP